LTLIGAAAIGIVLLILCGANVDLLPAGPRRMAPKARTAAQTWILARDSGLKAAPVLFNDVRSGRASVSTTINALVTLGPSVIPFLVSGLDDCDPRVRLVSTRTIGDLGRRLEPEAGTVMPPLIRRLHDHSPEIRQAAMIALLSFGPSREAAIPGLIDHLQDLNLASPADRTCLQLCAAELLGRIGPGARAAIPSLQGVLLDSTSEARTAAATALWRISCDPNLVFPELARMLAEPNRSAQTQALTALQRISREAELTPELLGRLRDANCHQPAMVLAEAP